MGEMAELDEIYLRFMERSNSEALRQSWLGVAETDMSRLLDLAFEARSIVGATVDLVVAAQALVRNAVVGGQFASVRSSDLAEVARCLHLLLCEGCATCQGECDG